LTEKKEQNINNKCQPEKVKSRYVKGRELELFFKKYLKEECEFEKVEHCGIHCGESLQYEIDLRGVKHNRNWLRRWLVSLLIFTVSTYLVFISSIDSDRLELLSGEWATVAEVYNFSTGILGMICIFSAIGFVLFIVRHKKEVWVECKNHKNRVNRDDVNLFALKVKEIMERRNHGFVFETEKWFVSTSEYQEGALALAEMHDVRLFRVITEKMTGKQIVIEIELGVN